jgi:hypothetical protein
MLFLDDKLKDIQKPLWKNEMKKVHHSGFKDGIAGYPRKRSLTKNRTPGQTASESFF